MNHDVSTVLQRLDQKRSCNGVVHDQRDTVFVRNIGNLANVQNRNLWVSDGLCKEELGVWANRCLPLVLIVLVLNEGDLDAQLCQGVFEQVVGTTVQSR